MKKIRKFILVNIKTVVAFVLGVVISGGVVYAATVAASQVSFNKTNSTQYGATATNVQDAITELYNIADNKECKSGYAKKNESSSGYECRLLFKDMILADNPTIKTNPDLTSATSENGESGLYKMSVTNSFGGGSGTTYYFRGDVTNNVVEFAGLIWRIVRINEDGTVRLIIDTSDYTTMTQFNGSYNDYTYMYYSNSGNYIKKKVEDWYTANITGTNASKVAAGNYFCEAAKVKDWSSQTSGNATMTLYSSYTPTLDCTKDGNGKQYVPGSVGLITFDEVVLAGGGKKNNKSYYLYKTASGGENNDSYGWWTMSPEGVDNDYALTWVMSRSASFIQEYVSNYHNLRPVINLKDDVSVTKDANTGHYIVN